MEKLIFIRHSQTLYNEKGLLQGSEIDITLTKKGLIDAYKTAIYVKLLIKENKKWKIYTSPLKRTLQTAKIFSDILEQDKVHVNKNIIERRTGIFTGKTKKEQREKREEINSEYKLENNDDKICEYTQEEPISEIVKRANYFLKDIREVNENIIVITHGIFIKNILKYCYDYEEISVDNCSIIIIKDKEVINLGNNHLKENMTIDKFSKNQILYCDFKYPEDHWALNVPEQYFICYVVVNDYKFLVKLNPSDARGYRLIVALFSNPKDDLNRIYTLDEQNALMIATNKMKYIMEKFDVLPVIEVAGNNSHKVINDELFPLIIVGTENEPKSLHSHIICSGINNYEHIEGVPLIGYEAGDLFNMRGPKSKWIKELLIKAVNEIRKKIPDEECFIY